MAVKSLPALIRIGDREVSLTDFLLGCAAGVDGVPGEESENSEWAVAQRVFLKAGFAALPGLHGDDGDWVQLGLELDTSAGPRLYGELAGLARALLDEAVAVNFFFMHKPPGMRVRFQAVTGRQDELRQRLMTMVESLPVRGVRPGVYEAENYLFGGGSSMEFVHQLFTADSLAWLEVHRDRPGVFQMPARCSGKARAAFTA